MFLQNIKIVIINGFNKLKTLKSAKLQKERKTPTKSRIKNHNKISEMKSLNIIICLQTTFSY